MAIYSSSKPTGGLGGFGSLPSFGGNSSGDLTSEELLLLAQAKGGKVGQIASELGGGNRTILSTIGNGLKQTFTGFVDLISIPGQVVAGMISKDFTIEEAIKENLRVSDVIFGDTNLFGGDEPTTMQKIGDFIVRLPVDILTDPLTYLTFGAHRATGILGKMGFGANSKVSLYQKAARAIGKNIDDGEVISRALSDFGQEGLGYAKKYEEALTAGTKTAGLAAKSAKDELIQRGLNKEVIDSIENNVKGFMKNTIDSPFNPDLAKKTISTILESNPALAESFIDKGGIKFFGKTLLEGQRIYKVASVIPGMKWLDNVTLPFRNQTMALFDKGLVKDGNEFIRIPEEFIQARTKLDSLVSSKNADFLKNMDDIQRVYNLNKNELDILTTSLNTSVIPADLRLQSAYFEMNGIRENMVKMMSDSGVPVSKMDNWVGLITVPNDTKFYKGNSMFSKEVGAAKQAQNIKAIKIADEGAIQKIPEIQGVINSLDTTAKFPELSATLSKIRTVEDGITAIGKKRDELVKSLTDSGSSIENALKNSDVVKLNELQNTMSRLKTSDITGQLNLIGARETAKLKGIPDDILATLGDDADAIHYLVDNENNIYKRVATTAQELRDAGIEGFDENLLTAWTVRGMQNIRQSLGHQFGEGLARNFGRWADEAPESWVSMSSALVNDEAKALASGFIRNDGVEMLFHPAVAKSFDDMMMGLGKGDEATAGFLKAYDTIQSYYKSYLTTMFPMFHGRNAISNVLLNFLDLGTQALNPKRHFMAIDMIIKDRKINKLMRVAKGTGDDAIKAMADVAQINNTKMFTDRVGHEWTYGELRNVIRENNIAFNPNITGALDIMNDRDSLANFYGIGQTKKQRYLQQANPFNVEQFKLTKGGMEVGRTIEEQSRLINFMSNLIDTGDITHAATRTRQFLFDYQNGLTKFEKTVLRRLIPFYSFTRFNLELQAKTLFSAPGKIATEIKAVQSLGSILGGERMTEKEVNLLPSWMKNNLNLKRRKEDGTYEVISGFGTPIEQPFQAFQGNSLMGSLSPLVKLPIEKMTGYNLFRGKMTSAVSDARVFRGAPEPIKQFIGYVEWEGVDKQGKKYTVYKSLRPNNMHTLNSLPFARFASTVSSITDSNISGGLRTLSAITGIQARPFEEEQLAAQREREMAQQLERLLQDSGIRGSFTRGYTKDKTKILEN